MDAKMSQQGTPNYTPNGPKWTVMVFMGAATINGSEPLSEAAQADLTEMRSVGSNHNLNIYVQIHRGDGKAPKEAYVKKGGPVEIDALDDVPNTTERRNLDNGQALLGFIENALKGHDARVDHTMLVLWGHAYDFAFGREKKINGVIDAIDLTDIGRILKRVQERFGGGQLDILGCDACDLATVEMACELAPFAKYLLASQIGVPIPGWPYDRILDRLRDPKGRIMLPAELGSYAVRRFCEAYSPESRPVSLTFLDLQRTEELLVNGGYLAKVLQEKIADPDMRDRIADLFWQSQTGDGKPYVDLADLCLTLVRRNSDDADIVEAATNLGDFLIKADPLVAGSRGASRPFVVEHGRNTCETARLNGISIYAPHVAPDLQFDPIFEMYKEFGFAKQTQWKDVVRALATLS